MSAVNTFKKTAVLALVCMLCTLCGCETITFSIDSLLAAPSIADEQAAVHDALIESVGGTVVPSYPRSGDYRSAFIITDIDADGNDDRDSGNGDNAADAAGRKYRTGSNAADYRIL